MASQRAGDLKPDGRSVRWAEHNEARRTQLVDATIRAIRKHGANVGMDEIAAQAGTSKTVIYRHFVDRAGLYRAVVARVDDTIIEELESSLEGTGSPRERLARTLDAYLALTEADPEVYRFVVRPPAGGVVLSDDLVLAMTTRAARQVENMLAPAIARRDLDPTLARTWSLAIVGSVYACADRWIFDAAPMPRAELVDHLTDLAWNGLGHILQNGESS